MHEYMNVKVNWKDFNKNKLQTKIYFITPINLHGCADMSNINQNYVRLFWLD